MHDFSMLLYSLMNLQCSAGLTTELFLPAIPVQMQCCSTTPTCLGQQFSLCYLYQLQLQPALKSTLVHELLDYEELNVLFIYIVFRIHTELPMFCQFLNQALLSMYCICIIFFSFLQAIKNNAGFRVWILFFLVMCSFSLLFLDWYGS